MKFRNCLPHFSESCILLTFYLFFLLCGTVLFSTVYSKYCLSSTFSTIFRYYNKVSAPENEVKKSRVGRGLSMAQLTKDSEIVEKWTVYCVVKFVSVATVALCSPSRRRRQVVEPSLLAQSRPSWRSCFGRHRSPPLAVVSQSSPTQRRRPLRRSPPSGIVVVTHSSPSPNPIVGDAQSHDSFLR